MLMCKYDNKIECENYFTRFGIDGNTECGHQWDMDRDFTHCGWTEEIGANLRREHERCQKLVAESREAGRLESK